LIEIQVDVVGEVTQKKTMNRPKLRGRGRQWLGKKTPLSSSAKKGMEWRAAEKDTPDTLNIHITLRTRNRLPSAEMTIGCRWPQTLILGKGKRKGNAITPHKKGKL